MEGEITQPELESLFDKACNPVDLGSLVVEGGRIKAGNVVQRAVVAVLNATNLMSEAQFIAAPQARFIFAYPENHGKWRRALALGVHLVDGMLLVGGNAGADQDGAGGLWYGARVQPGLPVEEHQALKGMVNRTTMRRNLPDDGLAIVPEGHYKDISAVGDLRVSLFSSRPQDRASNGFMRARVLVALQRAITGDAEGTIASAGHIQPPLFWTAPGSGPLNLRFMGQENGVCITQSLQLVNKEVIERARTGRWSLPGFDDDNRRLTSNVEGTIKSMSEDTTTIVVQDDNGSEVSFTRPGEVDVANHIESMVGMAPRHTKLVPLAEVGDRVGPTTCLWGPVEMAMYAGGEDGLFAEITPAHSQVARLWATLASGIETVHGPMYPVELVCPGDIDQVYLQVRGTDEGREWDRRVQQVILENHPDKCLSFSAPGIAIDGFECSQRVLNTPRQRTYPERRPQTRSDSGPKVGDRKKKKRRNRRRPGKPESAESQKQTAQSKPAEEQAKQEPAPEPEKVDEPVTQPVPESTEEQTAAPQSE